jgi:hypothetical protein
MGYLQFSWIELFGVFFALALHYAPNVEFDSHVVELVLVLAFKLIDRVAQKELRCSRSSGALHE